jgi:hypothetical protein
MHMRMDMHMCTRIAMEEIGWPARVTPANMGYRRSAVNAKSPYDTRGMLPEPIAYCLLLPSRGLKLHA